jgi:hypothetical protein
LKQIFRRIAKNYETLFDLGDYKFPLDSIASTMVKVLEKLGLGEYRRSLYTALEDPSYQKFKRIYTKEIYEVDLNVQEDHFFLPEESRLTFDEIKQAYDVIKHADYKLLTRRQFQENAEMGDHIKLFSEQQCESRGIPVVNPVSKGDLATLDEMNPFREVTHLQKPERREGATFEEIGKCIEDLTAFKEKVAEFNIPLDIDFSWAKAWHAFRMFIRPWNDDKWRRDWGGWAEILSTRKDTTKHGAQSLSELEGARIRGYDETGKPIKVFKGITCEQIDNKSEQATEAFIYMYKNIPFLYHCVAAYRSAKVPFFVDFTDDLSPKLSHSS